MVTMMVILNVCECGEKFRPTPGRSRCRECAVRRGRTATHTPRRDTPRVSVGPMRTCRGCVLEFQAHNGAQRYCTRECATAARRQRQR